MTSSLDTLAERLDRVERELARRKSTPSLAHSSVEDGFIGVNTLEGMQAMQVGKQYDGTQVASSLVGPTPPTPTTPVVTPAPGGLLVQWDGLFTDSDAVAPMDFSRVEVHVGATATFDSTTALTLKGTIETPRGGGVVVIDLPPGVELWAKLRTRALTGKISTASSSAPGTPDFISGDLVAQNATMRKLILTSTTDANTSDGNEPPLRIGDILAGHLRIDGNEILAMADPTTLGALALQGKLLRRWNWDTTTVTTNSSGNATINHGLGTIPAAVIASGNVERKNVASYGRTASQFTVGVTNADATAYVGDIAIGWVALA